MVSINQLALSSLLLSWNTNASLAFTISSSPQTLSRKLISSTTSTLVLQASANDDFDPRFSPHAYPKGTSSTSESNAEETQEEEEEDWSPMKLNSVKKDFQGASNEEYNVERSSFTQQWSAVSTTSSAYNDNDNHHDHDTEEEAALVPVPVPVADFDPLISPHAYSKGTSAKPMVTSKPTTTPPIKPTPKQPIGILLIDHGSKRPTSNQRLDILKDMYQNSPNTPEHYTIKAAHMEIASPSIKEQMEEFYKEGVKKIVCHPYFLSPGRHVLEDIPVLIQEAEEYLEEKYCNGKEDSDGHADGRGNGDYELEVLLTEPVGSKLDLMIGLIGSMVQEALGEDDEGDEGMDAYESGFVPKAKDPSELGGFFGNIQRMLDEQLD